MAGRIQSLWRYPVKGFTPERLDTATLTAGAYFPCDRIFAVEDGPSGFDPADPKFVSKQKFTVLAKIAAVARARTAYDETTGQFSVEVEDRPALRADLNIADGRQALCDWLTDVLGDEARGPLKVVQAPGHRFTDHPLGYVSIVNLASVRDLEAQIGRPIDPLRFRANLYVEGWPAWIEADAKDASITLGDATASAFSPIKRCVATHVNPATGERDMDLVRAIFDHRGDMDCGLYVSVTQGGVLRAGDIAEIAA
jgi:uncharacterized protein YcbX